MKGLFDLDEEASIILPEDVEVINLSEYKEELAEDFEQILEVAKPLLRGAKIAFSKIEKALHTVLAFINVVKAAMPDVTLQAVLTDCQKLLQAIEIKNSELKAVALIHLTSATEDSRNLLMLSQKSNVEFI